MTILYELSRILLPTPEFIENENLFLNIKQSKCLIDNEFTNVFVYKFNTWMNIFPSKKYFEYCALNDLYLDIEVDKDAEILIYALNYKEITTCEELICKQKLGANTQQKIQITNPEKYENIYFSIVTKTDNLNIRKAAWCTTNQPLQDNKLAIITCTFKREDYVLKNISIFNEFLENNKNLSDKIKLFVIDNGKTLSEKIENQNVKLFPNKNAGGAGGFTRGIIEAKNSNENFTRILLMDDDVEVFPESFFRTLQLANYLKPKYQKAFIHGAMLNMDKKHLFFESIAIKTDNWCYSYHGETNIENPQNIAKTNYTPRELFLDEQNKASSAWWYCCFSMDSVKEKGLPLPVFFRCDDLEWSWRNFGEHHITANGISVWHAPFEWRVSKPVEYYFSKRNIILINFLYTPAYKNKMLKMLKNDFLHLIKTYDYTSCEIYLRMMEDILKGSKILNKDPEELLSEIFSYTKNDKIENITNLSTSKKMREKYEQITKEKKQYKRVICIIKRIFWELTLHGILVPQILWKKNKNIWASAPSEEFMFCKKLSLWNLGTNKVESREYRKNIQDVLNKKFRCLYKKIDNNYELLAQEFKNNFKEYTSEDFWKKYLNI